MASPHAARSVALAAIRVIGYAVAAVAAAYGISQVVLAFVTPTTTVPASQYGLVDLPVDIRLVVTAAVLVASLTIAVVALAIGQLAWRVRREAPFVRETTSTVTVIGVALVVGPLLAQALAHIGHQLVVQNGSDETFEFSWFLVPDFSLPGVGVALLLVAGILRDGERLQRETEGLV